MANPRQRRKARSSSHRPVLHSRRAKRNTKKTHSIRGPRLLQEVWDKKKTVKQNYATLGLLHTLNPLSSGGTETRFTDKSECQAEQQRTPSQFCEPDQDPIPQGYGRITRDGTGNVIRVEECQASVEEKDSSMGMEKLDPIIDTSVLSKWSMNGCEKKGNNIVDALEQLSSLQTASGTLSFPLSGVGSRHASLGERSHLRKLVDKYGENTERMALDRKLNPEQRTAGQLKKALERAGLCR